MIAAPFGIYSLWTSLGDAPPPPIDFPPGTFPAWLDCYDPNDASPPPSNGYVPSNDPNCAGPEDL